MRNLLRLTFLILAGTAFAVAADDKPANLLTNGGFEDVKDNKPVGWNIFKHEDGKAEFQSSTDKPKEGKKCMLMKGDAEWAVVASPKVAIDQKKTYTLTGYVRVKSGKGRIKLDYYKGDEWLGHIEGEDQDGKDWVQVKVVGEGNKFPDATQMAGVAVGSGEFEVSFDDFVLTAK